MKGSNNVLHILLGDVRHHGIGVGRCQQAVQVPETMAAKAALRFHLRQRPSLCTYPQGNTRVGKLTVRQCTTKGCTGSVAKGTVHSKGAHWQHLKGTCRHCCCSGSRPTSMELGGSAACISASTARMSAMLHCGNSPSVGFPPRSGRSQWCSQIPFGRYDTHRSLVQAPLHACARARAHVCVRVRVCARVRVCGARLWEYVVAWCVRVCVCVWRTVVGNT